jgi:DNA-directed RNA polymerase subunit RPC12/RpoP
MKQTHRVDLTEIDGNGDLACPQCGIVISPEDSTEEKYSVLEPKVNKNCLEEVVIRCNSCGSHIHLTGFSLLQEIA